eukprot:6182344-Pleurochrysis_carterae.AAC.1
MHPPLVQLHPLRSSTDPFHRSVDPLACVPWRSFLRYAELRAQREAEASARAAVASDSSAHARTMAAAAAASGGGGGGGSGAQKLKRPSAKKSNRPAPTHTPMLGVNETAPVGVHAFQAAGAPQVAWPEW